MTNRQRRRQFDRQLRKLIRTKGDNCTLCGTEFQHNRRTFGGYDQDGEIALVGACCVERLHEVHTAGVFSHRNYDFLAPGENKDTNDVGYSVEQVAHALGTVQRAIAGTDKELKDVWQRGGMSSPHGPIHTRDHPWKTDDRDWFERHPKRSHRARPPFAGEVKPEDAGDTPEGHELIMLLRQVEPGKRIKAGFFIPSQVLPVPDVESVAHALFDIATERAPMPRSREAMHALIEKYQELPEVM